MTTKIKNISHRYDINRPRSRHRCKYGKYIICLTMMMLKHLSSNTEATFEAQFKRKLSNTDA